MTGVTHSKVSALADGADTSLVRPSDWNDDHYVATFDVKRYGATGDGSTDDTSAINDTFDAALTSLQATAGGGVRVRFPEGRYVVTWELLSDDFQSKWWLQTNLGKLKFLTVAGDGSGASQIIISSSWPSAVRNSANATERTYGPWANDPSPAILFPAIARNTSGAPASFSIRDLRIVGSEQPGKDPIALLVMNELDARHTDVHITGVRNSAHVLMGSYNSVHTRVHAEGCGLQPVESGSIAGYAAGFPPVWVRFDLSAGTISAKASAEYGGYSIGDPVAYFTADHVNQTLIVDRAAVINGINQPLKVTITAVAGDGESASFTAQGGVTVLDPATDRNVSWLPVKATTSATSAVVTLSAPVLIGDGATDMVGMLVSIPKAGSTARDRRDVLTSRIVSCDTGDDIDGYTQVTLADAARFTVTDLFITGPVHMASVDETVAGTAWQLNDTDFISCRWETAGGYADDRASSSAMFLVSDCTGAVQYIGCKVHGCNPDRGQFAGECQAIVDSASTGLGFIGCDFTHLGMMSTGALRFMGDYGVCSLVGVEIGGWQLPHDFVGMYLDPQTGYTSAYWGIIGADAVIVTDQDAFPQASQARYAGRAGLTNYDLRYLLQSRQMRGAPTTLLDDGDDLDDVVVTGVYYWDNASLPANIPTFGGFSVMTVYSTVTTGATNAKQVLHDLDNNWVMQRDKFAGAWSTWRLMDGLHSAATTGYADIANFCNVHKGAGTLGYNTTNSKLLVSLGDAPGDLWAYADGSGTITPS